MVRKKNPMVKKDDRLIVALDVESVEEAKNLVNKIGDKISFYKIGLELMASGSYFDLVKWLKDGDKKVFCDLKLYDISKTVERSVANLAKHNIDLLTIHSASLDIMQKAANAKQNMEVIAVSVLTNLDEDDLNSMGFDPNLSVENLVVKKAKLSLEAGLDGVVASALEAKMLRNNLGNNFKIITPGIRLNQIEGDDQKRVCDAKTALKNGSSHLVVGRPITRSDDPRAQAEKFIQAIS